MRNLLLLVLLLVALAALRLTGLDAHGLGIDEAWDITVAARPLPELLEQFSHPPAGTHTPPPLHYILLQLLLGGGGEPLLLARAWSALWGVAAGLVLAVAGYRRLPLPVLLAALLFLVLQPFQQYWSQQTRPYAFMQFCAVAAYALLAQVAEKKSWRAAAGLALVLTAGLYTHYYFLLVWATVAMLGLWLRPWREPALRLPLTLGVAAPLLLFLPWAGVLAGRLGDTTIVGSTYVSSFIDVWREMVVLLLGNPLPKTALYLTVKYLGLAGAGVLFLLALPELRRRPWLALPVVLPLGVALLVGLVTPMFAARYLFIVQAPLLLLLALPLAGAHRRAAALAAGCYALALFAGSAATLHAEYPQADDFRGAAAAIARGWQPGDVLCCIAPYVKLPLAYYLPETQATYLEQAALPATGSRRLWLVWSHWQYHDPAGSILANLRATRPLAGEIQLAGVTVYLFAPAIGPEQHNAQ